MIRPAGATSADPSRREYTLWIPQQGLAEMMSEADQRAPFETGGVLLGYWAASRDAAVVEFVVGPGPRAVHRRANFTPDCEHQEREIARLYSEADGNLQYLGDWHTHPNGPAALSNKDLSTLRRIARYRAARAPHPVMLLLVGGEPWRLAGWLGELRARRWWRDGIVAHPLSLELE